MQLLSFFVSSRFLVYLIGVSIIVILIAFVYNQLSGQRGKYTDHTGFIYDLLRAPSSRGSSARGSMFGGGARSTMTSKGELECKRVIEKLTGKSFPKTRPSFLTNSVTGVPLELDCYNDELKLAVEYNGEQHYKYIPYFHGPNKDSFYNGQYRDEIKARLCRENGVRLIVVPYTVDDIESYLSERLKD